MGACTHQRRARERKRREHIDKRIIADAIDLRSEHLARPLPDRLCLIHSRPPFHPCKRLRRGYTPFILLKKSARKRISSIFYIRFNYKDMITKRQSKTGEVGLSRAGRRIFRMVKWDGKRPVFLRGGQAGRKKNGNIRKTFPCGSAAPLAPVRRSAPAGAASYIYI